MSRCADQLGFIGLLQRLRISLTATATDKITKVLMAIKVASDTVRSIKAEPVCLTAATEVFMVMAPLVITANENQYTK